MSESGKEVRFELLGAVRAYVDDEQVAVSGKQRVLLAALLLHANELLETARLVDAIWGDRPPRNARNQVQGCVSRLRKRLTAAGIADPIITDQVGYEIQIEARQLDLELFRQRVNRARTAAKQGRPAEAAAEYRAALACWRGPALTGVDSDLLRSAAASLEEERLQAAEERIDIELGLGAGGDLVAELTDLVGEHPYRESLHAALMVALYRAGRQADALAAYQRVHRMLVDEVGAEPGPALRELQQRILNEHETLLTSLSPRPSDVTAPAGARNCLPRTVGDFTGRPEAVARMLDAAEYVGGTPNVLTIDGMAGIGKTTLALHVAHLLADRFPDAQLFVDLHGHSERRAMEPAAALEVLLRQLGIGGGRIPLGLEERASLLRSEFARCRALVILDNAASTGQVVPLLPGASNCLVMVTSRRSLTGLDAARPVSIDLLTTDESVALLAKIVGDRVREEPEPAVVVSRICGHLPLAIRLAGARLAHRPGWRVEDLANKLIGAGELLTELAADDRTVADAFALSYSQLGEGHQRIFRLLGLHPGEEFDACAAAALVDCDLETARQVLDGMVDRHLLGEPRPGRYRFHDLVREFANRLVSAAETKTHRSTVLKRLLSFYLHAVAGASESLGMASGQAPDFGEAERPDLVGGVVSRGAAWLEIERQNMVSAVRAAWTDGADQHAWQLARAGWAFYFYRGYTDDLLETHHHGMMAAERLGSRDAVATMCNYLASAHYKRCELGRAEKLLKQSLSIRTASEDRTGAAGTRSNLGLVYRRQGRLAEAAGIYQQALVEHQREQSILGVATALQNLGVTYMELGRYDEAARCQRRRLAMSRENGDLQGIVDPLGGLGEIRARLGERAAAERLLRAAYRLSGRVGHRESEVVFGNQLGAVCRGLGRWDEAVVRHREALVTAQEMGDLACVCMVRNELGKTLCESGESVAAIGEHRAALAAATRVGLKLEQARALDGIAACLRDADPADARRHWQRALVLYREMGVPEQAEVERDLAELAGDPRFRAVSAG